MIIKLTENGLKIINQDERKSYYDENGFLLAKGENGNNYALINTVSGNILNVSEGNEKVGNTICFNLPIEYTCSHCCECYKLSLCYAEGGCYNFPDNQAKYSENLKFFRETDRETFIQALQLAIDSIGFKLFRWFTCGDIVNSLFLDYMVEIARNNPDVEFWAYTKKYAICNKYVESHGGSIEKAFPANLVIIFSHWLNQDKTYYPMHNPYNFPTSEYIPVGMEELAKKATFICPCSDPESIATCETCENKCYHLKPGQSQALLEHSTAASKERDREIKEKKKAKKAAEKAAKKAEKEKEKAAKQAAKQAGKAVKKAS